MRAVNLLPSEYRRVKSAGVRGLRGPGHLIVGLLAIALALVVVYVLTSNAASDQKSKLSALQQEVPQVQALATRLSAYTQFATLAQQRAQTVNQIASTRFDWAASMADLSRVVPANTSLQSLMATAGTSSSAAGSSTSGSGIRAALPNPAFELRGCTASQVDVARLMSRLRLMNGVIRVTLSDAAKQGSAGSAATPGVAGSASSGGGDCPQSASSFDLVVFFASPNAGGSPSGQTGTAQPAGTSTTQATGNQ